MKTTISMLAIDLAQGSFQVCAIGTEGRAWMPPVWQAPSSLFRQGLDRTCVRPLNVGFHDARAGMLFGRLGSHRLRELQGLEPRV